MVKPTVHQINIRSPFWEQIRIGRKTVEGRCATPKYAVIKSGDQLSITKGDESFTRNVTKTKYYNTFIEMIRDVGHKKLLPGTKSAEEAREIYLKFPGYRNEEKVHGAVAIWIAPKKR
jgi:ASC-1-like (ASCH) protein